MTEFLISISDVEPPDLQLASALQTEASHDSPLHSKDSRVLLPLPFELMRIARQRQRLGVPPAAARRSSRPVLLQGLQHLPALPRHSPDHRHTLSGKHLLTYSHSGAPPAAERRFASNI